MALTSDQMAAMRRKFNLDRKVIPFTPIRIWVKTEYEDSAFIESLSLFLEEFENRRAAPEPKKKRKRN